MEAKDRAFMNLTEFDIILNSRGATERLNESSGG